ncbi:hypothetical protein [Paenibacillus stellifer]|uniref:hypothetical protein n=1 Tax=Paenibacillus stellifer TaxID=169760 RepID=UPI000A4A82BC|nr:hypothetical protein [Paenibacillus stellifer]
MDGWIKLHRKVMENPIVCKDGDHLAVWMYLLLNATHKEVPAVFMGQRISLQPGQLITGRKVISDKFNISESKVQRILKSFENERQIEQQNGNKNRLISVISWPEYQECEQQDEQQLNNKRTTTEQQVNTNKNVKNVKNLRTKEDIKPLCDSPPAEPHVDSYHPDFERFWKVFPTRRRKDKAKAFATWKKKVKQAEREALIQCTILYSQDFETIGLHSEFAKMPTTYLNAGTYKDYLGGDESGPEGLEPSGRGQAATGEYDKFGPPPPEPDDYIGAYYGHASRNGGGSEGRGRAEAGSDDDIFVRR